MFKPPEIQDFQKQMVGEKKYGHKGIHIFMATEQIKWQGLLRSVCQAPGAIVYLFIYFIPEELSSWF